MGISKSINSLSPDAKTSIIKTKIICDTVSKIVTSSAAAVIISSVMLGYAAHCVKTINLELTRYPNRPSYRHYYNKYHKEEEA